MNNFIIKKSSNLSFNFCKKKDKSVSTITFSNDIATLIQNLDPYKVHGHGMISFCMLKLCVKSISNIFRLIFQSCIQQGEFPTEKKSKCCYVFPIHKKVTSIFKKIIDLYLYYPSVEGSLNV